MTKTYTYKRFICNVQSRRIATNYYAQEYMHRNMINDKHHQLAKFDHQTSFINHISHSLSKTETNKVVSSFVNFYGIEINRVKLNKCYSHEKKIHFSIAINQHKRLLHHPNSKTNRCKMVPFQIVLTWVTL